MQTQPQSLALDTRLISSISILISFLLAVPLSSLLHPFVVGGEHLYLVLVVASSLLLIGLVHDLFSMLPTWHIGALVSGGVVIWSIGDGIALQEQLPTAATLILTVLWFVIVPTAFKQLDASERLAAGIAILIGLGLFALAMMNLQPRLATCAIGLVGSNLGVLVQPRYSARPHLGTGGALLDGFVIAYIALMLYPQQVSTSVLFVLVSALIPLLLCLVPLINIVTTLFATILRIFDNSNTMPSSINSLLSVVISRESFSTVLIFLGVSVTSLVAIILNGINSTVGLTIGLLTVFTYVTFTIFLLCHSLRRQVEGQSKMRADTL
jgi:UDP-N-acetylmuramyl pentapeptide phosphotransferase/UDP-N-acetylglucosamine-1-phosphate transferase